MSGKIVVSTEFTVEFYDVDSMQVVWHGNYAKFFEVGRCALLEHIGYGYIEMEKSGYAWPVVDMRIKYARPLVFRQRARIEATLLEYENRLRIAYRIFDAESGTLVTKGESTQMAVNISTRESLFVSPPCLVDRVEAMLSSGETSDAR